MKRAAVVLLIAATTTLLAEAQYGGYHMGGQEAGYESADYGADERPKVHLGLRLRIPAFKFELPRMSLPKITISAKIRQPDRPRTITLPEINLDTSSKVEPPGAKGQSSGYHPPASSYGHQPGYSMPSGHEEEHTSSFSFSTSEDQSSSHRPSPSYSHHQQQHQSYGSPSNLRPAYQQASTFNQPQSQQGYYQMAANPDLGFNSPVYATSASLQPHQTGNPPRVPAAQADAAGPDYRRAASSFGDRLGKRHVG